jgi:hypothetical protein
MRVVPLLMQVSIFRLYHLGIASYTWYDRNIKRQIKTLKMFELQRNSIVDSGLNLLSQIKLDSDVISCNASSISLFFCLGPGQHTSQPYLTKTSRVHRSRRACHGGQALVLPFSDSTSSPIVHLKDNSQPCRRKGSSHTSPRRPRRPPRER